MKIYRILAFFLFVICISCNKDDHSIYPNEFKESDLETNEDCSLSLCSNERITRYTVKDYEGVIKKSFEFDDIYYISHPLSSDSAIKLFICDLPEEYKEIGIEVEISGELKDPCGQYAAVWPIEEAFIFHISKIKKL